MSDNLSHHERWTFRCVWCHEFLGDAPASFSSGTYQHIACESEASARAEAEDRAEYERLKAKFGDKQVCDE